MTFKENLAADVTNVFLNTDQFAEAATYYAAGVGSGAAISAVFQRDNTLPGYFDDGQIDSAHGVMYCDRSVIATPTLEDTVKVGDDIFAVRMFDEQDDDIIAFQLVAFDRDRLGGATSRIQR